MVLGGEGGNILLPRTAFGTVVRKPRRSGLEEVRLAIAFGPLWTLNSAPSFAKARKGHCSYCCLHLDLRWVATYDGGLVEEVRVVGVVVWRCIVYECGARGGGVGAGELLWVWCECW